MSTVTIALGASIQAAIDANPAGTTFQLAAGTYYGEQFTPQSGDSFVGDSSGGTILSGAVQLTNWTSQGSYWVEGNLPQQSTGQSASGSATNYNNLNDLFINNTLLTRVSSESQLTSGTWYYDAGSNSAVIANNPAGQNVQMSYTPTMVQGSNATNVTFSNLTTEMYATDAQMGPIRTGSGWQIDNVTSIDNHGAGLLLGANTTVQGGSFSNNGQIGIEGGGANNSQVLNAQINNNNYAGYNQQWDGGGIKAGGANNFVVSGDTVSGNNGQGVWADLDAANWTISNNTISNNVYNGILYELSHGNTQITNNTVTNNQGSGIYISNSDAVTASGNTVTVGANNSFSTVAAAMGGGIDVINNSGRGTDPSGTPYLALNDTVTNNTIIHPGDSTQDGIFAFQALPGGNNDVFNNNTYYTTNANGQYWQFNGTNDTWSQLKATGTYETSGTDNVGSAPTASAAAVITPTTTAGAAAVTTPTPTATTAATTAAATTGASPDVTIAADQTNATVSQSQISVAATAGDHIVMITGTGDVISLTGGNNTVTENGNGNLLGLPAAGQGSDTFTNNIFYQGDDLDLTAALAATDWNGSASTLPQYLSLTPNSTGETLSISPTAGGTGVAIANIGGNFNGSLDFLLAHSHT
jgi:parallel beta-helix repeat protein